MRFTNIIVASIFAIAARAQDDSSITDEQKACMSKCDSGDVTCLAHCSPVPSPTEDDLAKLHDCSAACDQGDGSEAATLAYADCQSECVLKYYYDPAVGTPGQGQSSGSGSSGSDSTSDSDSSSDSNADGDSDDSTGNDSDNDGDSADSNGNGSDNTDKSGASALVVSSLLGVVAAVLAL